MCEDMHSHSSHDTVNQFDVRSKKRAFSTGRLQQKCSDLERSVSRVK